MRTALKIILFGGLPHLPSGYVFVVDNDGFYLIDNTGAYYIEISP